MAQTIFFRWLKEYGRLAAQRESAERAAELIREAAFREEVDSRALVLPCDNGGPMKGATMLAALQWLGIVPSLSRLGVPKDNPHSEALLRTVKYRREPPTGTFESLEACREWMVRFVRWYNHQHRHSAIHIVTPAQRQSGEEKEILARRKKCYEEAKRNKPNRSSDQTRSRMPVGDVIFNPSVQRSRRFAEARESA